MITEQVKNMLYSQVIEALTWLVPKLIQIGGGILVLFVVVWIAWTIIGFICPEISDFVHGVAGEMWGNYKSERAERFANSPVGRGVAAYKERSSVHEGASYPVESYSLGPKEYQENGGSFSGYDYNNMYDIVPGDNVDLED